MKKLLKFLLMLLILVPLLAVLATVPAHLQIGAIKPVLPSFKQIHEAVTTPDGPVSVAYVNSASQTSPAGTMGHPAVLLEWADGRRFMIDTGMPPEAAIAFGEPLELLLDAQPAKPHGSVAQQLGEKIQAIGGIAFTHLHSDHTDGLPEICSGQQQAATVYQTPLQFRERNYTTDMGYAALEAANCAIQELPEKMVMPLPDFPGLVAISMGGHTPGSTLYVAYQKGHYWAFSGDITNDKHSLLHNVPKHWLYSRFIVPEDTERTEELRLWLRELNERENVTVLPAHDVPEMARHLPNAGVANP